MIDSKAPDERAKPYVYTYNALSSLLTTLEEQEKLEKEQEKLEEEQQKLKKDNEKEQPHDNHRSKAKEELRPLVWANFESVLHTVDDEVAQTEPTSLSDYKKKHKPVASCDRDERLTLLSEAEHRLSDSMDKRGNYCPLIASQLTNLLSNQACQKLNQMTAAITGTQRKRKRCCMMVS